MARAILVDDDIYEFILKNTREIGESASDILRRLLKIDNKSTSNNQRLEELQKILTPLDTKRNATEKFLFILSTLHDMNPDYFEKVLSIRGTKRSYFARRKEDIESSGRSTFPKRIPNSDYWVVTNNDTPKKKHIIETVMRTLNYSNQEIRYTVDRFSTPDELVHNCRT